MCGSYSPLPYLSLDPPSPPFTQLCVLFIFKAPRPNSTGACLPSKENSQKSLFLPTLLSLQLITANNSLTMCGTLCTTLYAGIWPSLVLHRSCICCWDHYEFLCAAVLLWPEDTLTSQSSDASGSYTLSTPFSAMIPGPSWKGHCRDGPFGAHHSSVSYSLNLGQW